MAARARKYDSDLLWELSQELYALFTGERTMPYTDPLHIKTLYGRRRAVRRLLHRIYQVSLWGRKREDYLPNWSLAELREQFEEERDDVDVNCSQRLAELLVADLFYYSDRFNNSRASRLTCLWRLFELAVEGEKRSCA
jgi:hypothetical protein